MGLSRPGMMWRCATAPAADNEPSDRIPQGAQHRVDVAAHEEQGDDREDQRVLGKALTMGVARQTNAQIELMISIGSTPRMNAPQIFEAW